MCVPTHGEHCAYQRHGQIDGYLSVADHALSPSNCIAIFCVYTHRANMELRAPFARVYGGFARKISIRPADFVFASSIPNLLESSWRSGLRPAGTLLSSSPFYQPPLFFVHEIPFYSIEKTFYRSLAYDFNGDHNLLLCYKSQPEAR